MEFLVSRNRKGAHSWARVRTDGKRTHITLKETKGNSDFEPMEEQEVLASDFERAVKIMSKLARSKAIYFRTAGSHTHSGGRPSL